MTRRLLVAAAYVIAGLIPQFALAGTITGVDTASATTFAVGVFQFIVFLIALGVVVHGFWEGFAQRKIIMAVVEIVIGLILGVIAFSAQAIAQGIGITGSLLH